MLAFVPVVPATPSPRAEALSQRLAETIEQFRQQNPELSGLEVRQAVRLAACRTEGANPALPVALALVLGAFVAGLGIFLAAERGAGNAAKWTPLAGVLAFIVVLVAVVALKRR